MIISKLGQQLKAARKKKYPKDTLLEFSHRICVSRATLQKMEKGDLSVSMEHYYKAATRLGIEKQFQDLFVLEVDLFEEYYD